MSSKAMSNSAASTLAALLTISAFAALLSIILLGATLAHAQPHTSLHLQELDAASRRQPSLAPPIAGNLFASLIAFALFLRERESNYRVSNLAAVGVYDTEVVSIGYVSTKSVDNELAPLRDVDNRRGRGPTDVGNLTPRRIEGEQNAAPLSVRCVELPVALAEEDQVSGDRHPGLRWQRHFFTPGDSSRPRVSGAKDAKGMGPWNHVDEGRTQMEPVREGSPIA